MQFSKSRVQETPSQVLALFRLACTLAVLLLLSTSLSLADNECSFVRSYKDQQCVYNIHLTQTSESCGSSSPSGRLGRRHFRRHLPEEDLGEVQSGFLKKMKEGERGGEEEEEGDETLDVQSDYVRKIDDMEKNFFFMKDQHEKRLKDLEGSVRDLLNLDLQPAPLQAKSSPTSSSATSQLTSLLKTSVQLSSGGQVPVREEKGGRLDSSILDRLHEEFGRLRQELRHKTEQLLDAQVKANETETLLEKSQVDIFGVNQDLLTAQHRIAVLERERAVLHNQLKDRNYRLEVTNRSLTELEQKLDSQQKQLLKLVRSENLLTENLMTCELMLNNSRQEQASLEERHKELKSRHTRTKTHLTIRERELMDCYQAKTQTFCGFEHPNLCGFTQPNDTSDFFDWDWGLGETPSRGTGPDGDHTCGTKTGHFMFIEASAKNRGMNAIIYSPLYRGLEQQCLEFYYHMNGRHIGTLNVYAKARGRELASVWRAYGNQGNIWSVARLAIPKELARAGYQIAFEGITENGYQGDMAIDDVTVTDGKCPEGVQAVLVVFNVTADQEALVEEGKQFARSLRKHRLASPLKAVARSKKVKVKGTSQKVKDAKEVKDAKDVKDATEVKDNEVDAGPVLEPLD